MAKQRIINTKFWSDSYVVNLNPLDRYLFLYLLTNEHTNICGIYELPLVTMANESGLEKEMLSKMIKRLKGKVYYFQGWVYLKNFAKHQSNNDSVRKGIDTALSLVPKEIMEKVQALDSLSQPLTEPEVFESEFESNLNSNLNTEVAPLLSTFGEFQKVKLSDEEYKKLVERFGEKNTIILIDELDQGIASKGYKYKSHYATILNWARRKIVEHNNKPTKKIGTV